MWLANTKCKKKKQTKKETKKQQLNDLNVLIHLYALHLSIAIAVKVYKKILSTEVPPTHTYDDLP